MSDAVLRHYYEQELRYLQQAGEEFGREHPDVAKRLSFERGIAVDPHVERLLQGFAFLAARIHKRIDDDFSEVSKSLLEMVYPHYLRPIPSFTVVALEPDASAPADGLAIEAGTALTTPPIGGVRCRFRTCYDTTIWPLEVVEAQWSGGGLDVALPGDPYAVLSVKMQTTGGRDLSELSIDSLRFYLDGDLPMVTELYEVLDNNCAGMFARPLGSREAPVAVGEGRIRPVGLEPSECLLDFPGRAFLGYQLLLEYFAFRQKYMFFDVDGLAAALRSSPDGKSDEEELGSGLELFFTVRSFRGADRQEMLERSVNVNTLRLGCTPAVNLWSTGERVPFDERETEHLVREQVPGEHPYRVYSIDGVSLARPGTSTRERIVPFLAHSRNADAKDEGPFWHSRRHESRWLGADSTDVSLALVDRKGEHVVPPYPNVEVEITAFNGDLPGKVIPVTSDEDLEGVLTLDGGGGALKRIAVLVRPTDPIEPTLEGSHLWSLISQLSLNYLSLVDDGGRALRELLHLYNVGNSDSGAEHILGISGVRSEPSFARVQTDHGVHFARGRRVHIEFDSDRFPSGGIYLFASVLNRFLGLYATMNSFTSMVAEVRSKNQTSTLKGWQPRAGARTLT